MEPKSDIEEHLRAASDAIMLLVSQVGELERHKRGVSPDDARFEELARAVRMAADGLADFARQEESWALGAARAGPEGLSAIDGVAAPHSLREALDEWRAVERRLQQAEPGTDESKRLFAEFRAARDRYMAAFEARSTRSGQPERGRRPA